MLNLFFISLMSQVLLVSLESFLTYESRLFFKSCLPQILLGPFLNTLTQMRRYYSNNILKFANFWECWDFLIFFPDIFALTFTKLVLISITVVRITNKKDYFNKHPIIVRLNALNGVSTSLAKVRIPGTKIKKKSLHSKIFAHLLKLQNVC